MKRLIAFAALLAIFIRLFSYSEFDKKLVQWLGEQFANGSLVHTSLQIELGRESSLSAGNTPEDPTDDGQSVLVYGSREASRHTKPPNTTEEPTKTSDMEMDQQTTPETAEENSSEILSTTIDGGLTISNDTSFVPDIPALMSEELLQSLPSEGPQILIIHTHGSEAYTPDEKDSYDGWEDSRTQDTEYNVVRIGDELKKALENHGLNVIHDRGIYDYPSYTGSYARSLAAAQSYLSQYPDIALIIDLHRDAIGSGDVVYKTMAEIAGESSSQIMLLVGTGENGLSHPNWIENLKLALHIQAALDLKYPSLARPIALKKERYNQHLTIGSLILEVGSNGNTLQEALNAARLFGDAAGTFFKGLVEKS